MIILAWLQNRRSGFGYYQKQGDSYKVLLVDMQAVARAQADCRRAQLRTAGPLQKLVWQLAGHEAQELL